MDIAPIPTSPAASAQPQVFGESSLGRDDFLQLLVAQLRNQDPLNPQEGHEFVAQLAQFSSVEQLANISSTLDAHSRQLSGLANQLSASAAQQAGLAGSIASGMNLSTASALIGQTVDVAGNTAAWNGSDPTTLGFDLAGPADSVEVVVRDAEGNRVRVLQLGGHGAGVHAAPWDGLDDEGQPLPSGAYTFEISAVDADGETVSSTPFLRGRVDRITIEDGGVLLWIGGQSVPLSELRSIVSD